ncbi:EAL domain-containing protein [Buttiauxella sp.]|uniref:EAL domain-containing protein n=1 Tax=Buttiauxella sp. TaxID=1972222 RepID=UPI003C73EC3A
MTVSHKDINVILTHISQGNPELALCVYYQPIIRLSDGHCTGAEALVRGQAQGRFVSPENFIGLLEENNDIGKVGIFVLRSAINFARKHRLHQQSDFVLSSNFSPVEINDCAVVEKIKTITDAAGYPSHRVMIEITETEIQLSTQGRKNAKGLQQHGFIVAWDDIRSHQDLNKNSPEFSSNVIKLDRSLLKEPHLPLTKDIISRCLADKFQLVAEGVEYAWQRDWLLQQNVKVCQGYYYSAPLEPHIFAQRYLFSCVDLT